jgi:hypothetical protein
MLERPGRANTKAALALDEKGWELRPVDEVGRAVEVRGATDGARAAESSPAPDATSKIEIAKGR